MADYISQVDLTVAVPSPQPKAQVSQLAVTAAVPSPQPKAQVSSAGLTIATKNTVVPTQSQVFVVT